MTSGTQEAPGPGGLLTEHEQYAFAQAGLL
jgi:hypothetical protein